MKSGILDKNDIEICDGDKVVYSKKYCTCSEATKFIDYACKIKFEYGGFYLLWAEQETVYDSECSSSLGLTLSELAMRTNDHGDGYNYYLPVKKLGCIEVIK